MVVQQYAHSTFLCMVAHGGNQIAYRDAKEVWHHLSRNVCTVTLPCQSQTALTAAQPGQLAPLALFCKSRLASSLLCSRWRKWIFRLVIFRRVRGWFLACAGEAGFDDETVVCELFTRYFYYFYKKMRQLVCTWYLSNEVFLFQARMLRMTAPESTTVYQTLFSLLAKVFPPLAVTFFLSTRPWPGVLKNRDGP